MKIQRIKLTVSGVLFLLLSATTCMAEEITVEHVSSRLVENSYYLDARIEFNLHDDLLEALEHGVELGINIMIKVKETRNWLWDRVYKQDTIKFKLDHRPLSDVYIVTNVRKSEQRQFDTLEYALKYMGKIDQHFLLDNDNITDEPGLTGLLRAEMNVDNLPPPLKPIAFLSNKWQMDGKWHRWTIRQE